MLKLELTGAYYWGLEGHQRDKASHNVFMLHQERTPNPPQSVIQTLEARLSGSTSLFVGMEDVFRSNAGKPLKSCREALAAYFRDETRTAMLDEMISLMPDMDALKFFESVIKSQSPARSSMLWVEKHPEGKNIHTELGVTTNALDEFVAWVEKAKPEVWEQIKGKTLELVPAKEFGVYRTTLDLDMRHETKPVEPHFRILMSSTPFEAERF